MVVTGLDAGGKSLFNITYRAGITSTTRELYVSNGLASGAGSYISVDSAGEIGGITKVLDGSSSNFNSTNPASAPAF